MYVIGWQSHITGRTEEKPMINSGHAWAHEEKKDIKHFLFSTLVFMIALKICNCIIFGALH